jgi:hypothetical protein
VSRFALHKFAAARDRPFFQVRREPVRVIEQKVRRKFVFSAARKFSRAHQAGDDGRSVEGE